MMATQEEQPDASTNDLLKPIEANLISVNATIKRAYDSIPNNPNKYPTLLAVSKLKPKDVILEAYRCGQRHFGENYIQELHDKSHDPEIQEKCPEIQWHLIGHIQSNKIRRLLDVPNLACVQTVDSINLAEKLNRLLESNPDGYRSPLKVLVQVNTSGEPEKSGIDPSQMVDLVRFVLNKCEWLKFTGLMTIGAYGYDTRLGPNPDFIRLIECRKTISETLDIPERDMELSMGMTADYEHAITMGSTIVRVGVAIFGERFRK